MSDALKGLLDRLDAVEGEAAALRAKHDEAKAFLDREAQAEIADFQKAAEMQSAIGFYETRLSALDQKADGLKTDLAAAIDDAMQALRTRVYVEHDALQAALIKKYAPVFGDAAKHVICDTLVYRNFVIQRLDPLVGLSCVANPVAKARALLKL